MVHMRPYLEYLAFGKAEYNDSPEFGKCYPTEHRAPHISDSIGHSLDPRRPDRH